MGGRVNYSGLVIAGVGFFLTRFTVTLAYTDPVRFYLAGVVPLALGLGLAAFGVALSVADVDGGLVRTTALWCVLGAASMLVLVVLTLVGSGAAGGDGPATVLSRAYLSNFLIGGSVGGTLTGLYASRNRRQRRELRQQAHRLDVLNRLLRHEVLNAVAVIRGYAVLGDDVAADAGTAVDDAIEDAATDIEHAIEEVKHLTRTTTGDGRVAERVDLAACLRESAAAVRERHPRAEVSIDGPSEGPTVTADGHLVQVFEHLLENAVVHAGDDQPSVDVAVTTTVTDVRVAVSDEGPGLPENQRALVERGEIDRFDDPGSGFGLNVVRFLLERYGGAAETDVGPNGTTVTVVLSRADGEAAGLRASRSSLVGVRPAVPELSVTLAAALAAGVCYGVAAELLGGSVAFIGVYYGAVDPVVGWLTHEFHSVVFGFVFAGLVSLVPPEHREGRRAFVAIGATGVAWGLVLWLLAAGVVSPVWLLLLGEQASVPTLSPLLLVTHLVWGLSIGVLVAWGYGSVAPWLRRHAGVVSG